MSKPRHPWTPTKPVFSRRQALKSRGGVLDSSPSRECLGKCSPEMRPPRRPGVRPRQDLWLPSRRTFA